MYAHTQMLSLSTIVLNSRDWSEILWLPEILCFKINLTISFIRKKPAGMHWLGYNDAVSSLNEAKTRIFQPTANFENFKICLYFVSQPACVGLQKFHMIKVIAADLRKCYSEDDLLTAPWRFLLYILLSPSLFFFIPLERYESHLRR